MRKIMSLIAVGAAAVAISFTAYSAGNTSNAADCSCCAHASACACKCNGNPAACTCAANCACTSCGSGCCGSR